MLVDNATTPQVASLCAGNLHGVCQNRDHSQNTQQKQLYGEALMGLKDSSRNRKKLLAYTRNLRVSQKVFVQLLVIRYSILPDAWVNLTPLMVSATTTCDENLKSKRVKVSPSSFCPPSSSGSLTAGTMQYYPNGLTRKVGKVSQ